MNRRSPVQVGDVIAKGLEKIGVTEQRVSSWLGRHCGCRKRRKRLNQLSDWAWSVIRGEKSVPEATQELDKIVRE